MSTDNNIKNYSAADIEKYWRGKLSAAEMHALEKAAMDDPFLADAMEGYKNAGSAAQNDLDILKEKLARRTRVETPVFYFRQKRSTWFRVAAAVIIICGLGLLTEELLFKKGQNEIADSKKNQAAVPEIDKKMVKPDSINNRVATLSDTTKIKADQKIQGKQESLIVKNKNYAIIDTSKNDDRVAGNLKLAEGKKDAISSSPPVIANAEKKEDALEKNTDKGKVINDSFYSFKKTSPQLKAKNSQAFAESYKNQGVLLSNRYNYRVVDAQNNPVPFANVMNTRDNVGTYTDVNGIFNLVSGDSVMNIQVKSLGYNASNFVLTPSKSPGNLVLKEDNDARQQLLVNNNKVVSSLSRKDSADFEEPEAGWPNYNTYIANNIKIPDNIRSKNSGSEVELSFDIDKSGQPVNIKVTRSSQCKECDEEAIRLLKEGPKWKRKGRKSKGSVTINVDK